MKSCFVLTVMLTSGATLLSLQLGNAATASDSQLSIEKLKVLDKRGYFTPGFKTVVHDLADTLKAEKDARDEEKKLTLQLPDMQKQSAAAQAKTAAMREDLAKFEHPEETDFVALQARMKDTTAPLEEQRELAQAYVWAYPTSAHFADAQQDLQDVQKKIADETQAEKDAEIARVAARAKLIQRAQAHDLGLAEWRDFLRDMSQDDLLRYLGRPASGNADYWTYAGDYVTDPITQKKVGLQVNFNGTRVLSVSPLTAPQP